MNVYYDIGSVYCSIIYTLYMHLMVIFLVGKHDSYLVIGSSFPGCLFLILALKGFMR